VNLIEGNNDTQALTTKTFIIGAVSLKYRWNGSGLDFSKNTVDIPSSNAVWTCRKMPKFWWTILPPPSALK
jgi:hypothetical protein